MTDIAESVEKTDAAPLAHKIIISFFALDAILKFVLAFSAIRMYPGTENSLFSYLNALLASRHSMIFLFIGAFNALLVLQLSARMASGRIWAIVFSGLQLLVVLFDPLARQVLDVAGIAGRLHVIASAGIYSFTLYYLLSGKMKEYLCR